MLHYSRPFNGQNELSAMIEEGNNNNDPPIRDPEEDQLEIRPTTGATQKINPVTMLRQAFRRKEWDLVHFYLGTHEYIGIS